MKLKGGLGVCLFGEAGWLVGEKGGLGGNYCTDHCMHAFTDHYCTDYCTTAPTGLLN